MTTELVSVTIDDISIQVPKGTMIIEAAKQAGVLIPHYCYHPSLPSPAVCRMCLVEVEKAPKLLPACVTTVTEGQVVHVNSAPAKKGRQGVLEFLLINHPLDCPICDQAGECELQDFVFQEGRSGSRYDDYPKRYSPVEDFGPDVLYVANRCILCTRCVRYMDSVVGETVLDVYQRGDRAYIGIDHDHLLDHPWAGNVVDLCPVGSLISKDFLHKARAWDLDKTASICPGCTQGCNITVDTRDTNVVRFRPRPNLDVNRHFICDVGRMDYRWLNRGDRVEAPLWKDAAGMHASDWDTALAKLQQLVSSTTGRVVVLGSGTVSCESIGWALKLTSAKQVVTAMQVPTGEEVPIGNVPNLALRRERAANLHGAQMLGMTAKWDDAIAQISGADLVILLNVQLDELAAIALSGAKRVVNLASVRDPRVSADLILPVTTMAEEQGVFVNRDGRAQRFLPAKPAPGMSRPMWWVMSQAWSLESGTTPPSTASEAFASLAEFGGLTYRDLGLLGRIVQAAAAPGAAS